MTAVGTSTTAGGSAAAAPAAREAPAGRGGFSFGTFLSCLNPLQYLPVVGTLYRAVTGDTIPTAVREAGGLVVSGLTGGPVGVAMALGADLVERAVGFDQEKFSQHILASVGLGHATPASSTHAVPSAVASAASPPSDIDLHAVRTQASAFAIPRDADADADALNGMELARLANFSYGRTVRLAAA